MFEENIRNILRRPDPPRGRLKEIKDWRPEKERLRIYSVDRRSRRGVEDSIEYEAAGDNLHHSYAPI